MSKELYHLSAIQMSSRYSHDASIRKNQNAIDFEISFFEGLVAESPDFLDALIPLAEAYTKKGLHHKGLEIDQKVCRLRPHDPMCHYNLACSYALLGKLDNALTSLEKAFSLGYRDLSHLQTDTDLESLRKDPRLRELLMRFFLPKPDRPPAGKQSNKP